jgi:hypothetical protein
MARLGQVPITCRQSEQASEPEETFVEIVYSVSVRGSPAAERDRNTWPALENLARNHPEAGVHFQSESPGTE